VSRTAVLLWPAPPGTLDRVDEKQGIYRDEVIEIIGALADISSDTLAILAILRGEEGGDDEEEMDS
jgi:hypothetical protein